jgi:hypothetical protein
MAGTLYAYAKLSTRARIPDPKDVYGLQGALSTKLNKPRPSSWIATRSRQEGTIEVMTATYDRHDLIQTDFL